MSSYRFWILRCYRYYNDLPRIQGMLIDIMQHMCLHNIVAAASVSVNFVVIIPYRLVLKILLKFLLLPVSYIRSFWLVLMALPWCCIARDVGCNDNGTSVCKTS